MKWKISPNYWNTDFSWPLKLEDKIEIFHDQITGWQLDIADKIINDKSVVERLGNHAGFAALHIVLCYFETMEKYRCGFVDKYDSKKYFKDGVKRIFPELDSQSHDMLYKLRNGFYHGSSLTRNAMLTHDQVPLSFDPKESLLVVDPHRLVPRLREDFVEYVKQLRDTSNLQLRQNFEKRFDS